MTRRLKLVRKIQALSQEEGQKQPAAAVWLQQQDDRARLRREEDPAHWQGRDYQDEGESRGEVNRGELDQ